jgi:hypothetical protein
LRPKHGFTTKAWACKDASWEWISGITSHAPESVGRCEGMKLPLQELVSQWTPESSKSDYKGQKSLDWTNYYTIECWNINVWNGLARPIWVLKTQVMAEKRAENQSANLTPDH